MPAYNHNPRTEADGRFTQVVGMLIEHGLARSERDFCLKLGIHPATVYKVRTGLQSMPAGLPMDMHLHFKVRPDYIRHGQGMVFETGKAAKTAPSAGMQPQVRLLPFVPAPARAGFVNDFIQGTPYQHLQRIPLVVDPTLEQLDEAVIIEVEGYSMQPTLLPGDRLLVTPIEPENWPHLHHGVFVVVLPDQIMVKRMGQNHLATTGSLHLVSDNPEAGNLEVPQLYLKGLYRIRQLMRTL